MSAELDLQYKLRHAAILEPLAENMRDFLTYLTFGLKRIDRVQARAKSPDRFLEKALKEGTSGRKYSDPINEIQDQIGARIVTFYIDDVEEVSLWIEKYFRHIERRKVFPDSDAAFGYFGFHYILPIPSDVIEPSWDKRAVPEFFELQIKTLFQHAWSEANHDLGYKEREGELPADGPRKMAWASAQAWGADQIFNDLFRQLSVGRAAQPNKPQS